MAVAVPAKLILMKVMEFSRNQRERDVLRGKELQNYAIHQCNDNNTNKPNPLNGMISSVLVNTGKLNGLKGKSGKKQRERSKCTPLGMPSAAVEPVM